MKKRTADQCVKAGKLKVSRLSKREELNNKDRFGIAIDCRDYCYAKTGAPHTHAALCEFADKIGLRHDTMRGFYDTFNVAEITGNKEIKPKQARRILGKFHDRNDAHEIRARAKVEEHADKVTTKIQSALEHANTVLNLVKRQLCRKEDREEWMLLATICGQVREAIFAKIGAIKK